MNRRKSKSFFDNVDWFDTSFDTIGIGRNMYKESSEVKNLKNFFYEETDDGKIELTMSVLGYDKDDLVINLFEDKITIKAEKPEKSPPLVIEIDATFTFPKDYDGTKTTGEVENGILTILIEKKDGKKPKLLKF